MSIRSRKKYNKKQKIKKDLKKKEVEKIAKSNKLDENETLSGKVKI